MLVGYNTNVPYKGTIYHVQTEDSGLKNPVIVTLLYLKGSILASKKSSYAHLVSSPDYKEKAKEMMKEQHKTMIKELIAGRHTPGGESPAAPERIQDSAEQQTEPKSQIAKSLDDILLEYIIKRNE